MSKKKSGRGKTAVPDNPNDRLIARNRKARHDYEVLETLEAGMVLMGSEVKSLRAGKVNLVDAWADVTDGEVILRNLHISPYEMANRFNHEPMRPRKLLLHSREIRKLIGKTTEKGLTLIPLSLYFKRGRVKCELGVARGRRTFDKRAAKADADNKRKLQQAMRGGIRRQGEEQ
jgi:SsrA-binding protein